MQPTSTGSRRVRLVALAAALALFAPVPATATAAFHLTSVREVSVGGPDSYVELQAYSSGQNFLGGHSLTLYDSAGAELGDGVALPDVPNGGDQRTALIGAAATPTGAGADIVDADVALLAGGGGAVCFEGVDCVSWGTFAPPTPLISPSGTPASSIPVGTALVRRIDRGCATLLEAGDDTNDSAADFTLEPPKPTPNSTAPTETACGVGEPHTAIDKGPRKQITGKRAKFRFSSLTAGASFECALDEKPFKPCESPFRVKRIKPGKHVFSVRAVAGGTPDPSPATYKFKRKGNPKR